MWVELNNMVQETILTSHQISSPELLGIQSPGRLGTADHLESQDHFQNLVVKPLQTEAKMVFEKLLALRDGGVPTEIEVKQFTMVSLPDKAPIETVDVKKEEVVGVDKAETIKE